MNHSYSFSRCLCGIQITILIPVRSVCICVRDDQKSRTFGAVFALLQGLVTAIFPTLSVKLVKNMIGKNFENASELEVKPAYRQQLRAIGVGLVAAAGTDLLLQSVTDGDAGPVGAGQSEFDDKADEGAD